MTAIRFGGCTNDTHLHVLTLAAEFNMDFTTLEELDGVVCDIHSRITNSLVGMLPRVPQHMTQDAHVYICNCKVIAPEAFQPNLFTMKSMTDATVVLLTNTCAATRNTRKLLSQANGLNYFYTKALRFIRGVALV